MADYKETTVTGTSWQRVYRVRIDNPTGGTPKLAFYEEQVTNLGNGKTIAEHVATLETDFDPANPLHLELYGKLNDLYVVLREARDSAPVDAPDEVPV